MNNPFRQALPAWTREQWSQASRASCKPSKKNKANQFKELSAAETRHFGDKLVRRHRDDELLVGFLNINSLPQTRTEEKNFDLSHLMLDYNFDHIGLAETGRCWHLLPDDDRLPQRLRGHFMSKQLYSTTAYNRHDKISGPNQHGGTASLSTGNLVGRKKDVGGDLTELGRWCWQRFRGQGEATLRLAAFYRPVPPGSGGNSVYAQHMTHFGNNDRDICPRQAFLDDLHAEIKSWIDQGDQVIVMGDINDYVGSHKIKSFFGKHDMREVILERHGTSGPATTRSNKSEQAVDGIWATKGINIMEGGYLPFHHGPKSDHRLLWVRLTHQSAFGSRLSPSLAPSARKLRMGHKQGQDRYSDTLLESTRAHRILDRFRALSNQYSSPPSAEAIREYEELDKLLIGGRKRANKKARRLHMSAVQTSRVVKVAQLRLRLANLLIQRKRPKSKVKWKTVTKLASITGRHWWLGLGRDALVQQRILARREYYKHKRNSGNLRSTYLEDLATQQSKEGNGDEVRRLHTLLAAAKTKERAVRLRRLKTGRRGAGVNRLLVPRRGNTAPTRAEEKGKEISPMEEVTARRPLEEISMREIGSRFRMSQNSACMTDPLVSQLQYNGVTQFGDKILLGEAPRLDGVDEATNTYLDQLKAVEGCLPEPAQPITFEAYIKETQRLREGTSSGISIVTPAMVKTEAMDPELAEICWHRFNFPWTTGYSPERYRWCTDLLIHKDPADHRPGKLRPIRLFDIEANMHNKCLGRHMMKRAERNGGLAKEQYGSRMGLAADIQALNTRLFYDLILLKRIPAASEFADLVSNYDLVVHSIASLAMQRVGVPKEPIVCTFTTLQNMVSSVRTAYGDSLQTMGGDIWAVPLNPPPQGLGQGNGAAPAIWAVVSTPILNALRDAGFGAAFKCCISGDSFQLVGYCFVDDSTIVQVAPSPDTPTSETVKLAQAGLDLFVGTAEATGGQVSEIKTKWYLMEFIWDKKGRWRLADNKATLTVNTPRGRQPITQLPVTQAARILGVWIAPDGSSSEQKKQLRQITDSWADRVRSGHVRKEDAWYYYQSTIKKSLEYPLVATTLSAKDCHYVEAPARSAALGASGLPPTMKLEAVAGTPCALGLNDGNLFATQGRKHVSALLNFGCSDSITGHHIRDAIEAHKLETGCGGCLFANNYSKLRHCLTPTWVTHTWDYLWDRNLVVEERTPCLQPRRENDSFLMEAFMRAGIDGENLATLNRCRMYLRAVTLSDIATGDGLAILKDRWNGSVPVDDSPYGWPPQAKPDNKSWEQWQSALALAYGLRRTLTLPSRYSLGLWTDSTVDPTWTHSPGEDRVYEKASDGFIPYSAILERRGRDSHRRYCRLPDELRESLPADATRTVCERIATTSVRFTGIATASRHTQPLSGISTHWRPEDEFEFTQEDKAYIAQAIRDGEAIGLSDGSFKENWGTAAFFLEGKQHLRHRLSGSCTTPGHGEDQEAYRSELSGLFCLVKAVHLICEEFDITTGKITIGCDGMEAIRKAMAEDTTYSCLSSNYDIISAIDLSIQNSPITWHWRHVKGHQDDHYGPLDRWASLNVEADTAAKLRWQVDHDNGPSGPRRHEIENEMWRVYGSVPLSLSTQKRVITRGVKISTNLRSIMDRAAHRQPLLSFWDEKGTLAKSSHRHVDWKALARASETANTTQHRWAVKYAAKCIPTGENLAKYGSWPKAACPRECDCQKESTDHVITCPKANKLWARLGTILRRWGEHNNAAPGLISALLQGLSRWRNGEDTADFVGNPLISTAYLSQCSIGWHQAIMGFLSSRWTTAQGAHLADTQSKQDPARWIASLIRKFWDTSWDLWNHRNHLLHSIDGPTKMNLIERISSRIEFHYERGMQGLPLRCQFLFRPPLQTILLRPIRHRVSWLSAVTSARQCARRNTSARMRLLDPDRRILSALIDGHQMAQLVKVDNTPPLRTTAGPDRTRTLYITRENDRSDLYDPDHDLARENTFIVPD